VVAEGVETEAQLGVLREQQVHRVQGNLLGVAAPAHEVEALLQAACGTFPIQAPARDSAPAARGRQPITRSQT